MLFDAARSLVPITSTRILPSGCTSCLRMRRPSNSNGTTIPCSWFASFSVLCWLGIACPPDLVVWFLPSPTKDKLFSQFSPTFTRKDGEPKIGWNFLHSIIISKVSIDIPSMLKKSYDVFESIDIFIAMTLKNPLQAIVALAQVDRRVSRRL
jgi:hypothetical protein